MWRNLHCLVPLLFIPIVIGCDSKQEYSWAFAQDMDSTIKENEYCRTSLADTLYNNATKDNLLREASTNVFIYLGDVETYKIYAFDSQASCETTLTNMVARQAVRGMN
jgi:hypothetical protein